MTTQQMLYVLKLKKLKVSIFVVLVPVSFSLFSFDEDIFTHLTPLSNRSVYRRECPR